MRKRQPTYRVGRPEQDFPTPEVVIPVDVWQRMMGYINACNTEINGFGHVRTIGNTILVEDVFILDQQASAAHVTVDQAALDAYVYQMILAGGNPGSIRFQWHSHVDMEAYFSFVDTANIENWPGEWLVSFVGNRRGEYQCRLDLMHPLRLAVEVQPRILSSLPRDVDEEIRSEITAKVHTTPVGLFKREKPSMPPRATGPAFHDPEDFEMVDAGGDHGR